MLARPTSEAKYISLCSGVMETLRRRGMKNDVGVISMGSPFIIKIDIQGEIALAKKEFVYQCKKHIDVGYHYTKKAVQQNIEALEYCQTDKKTADLLTIALRKTKFRKFRENCGPKFLERS